MCIYVLTTLINAIFTELLLNCLFSAVSQKSHSSMAEVIYFFDLQENWQPCYIPYFDSRQKYCL
jgi:hypothetical protein